MLSRYKILIAPLSLFLFIPPVQSQIPPDSGGGAAPSESKDGVYSLTIEIISPAQVSAYQNGADPSEIVLATGETLEEFLAGKTTAPVFSVGRRSVASGGESESNDGQIKLRSTIGQPVTGEAESPDGTVKLGLGFQTSDKRIFGDGFESGDASRWDLTAGGS